MCDLISELFRPFLREPDRPCILLISRLVKSKNILTMVNAYGQSPELQKRVRAAASLACFSFI